MHAEIARETIARHAWKTPYANGSPVRSSSRFLDWSIAASFRLFGVSDWAARLPIALCVLALAITLFFFGRKLFGWNAAGFYAALFFLVWPGTFLATRDLSIGPFLCLEVTLIAFALWQFLLIEKVDGLKTIAVSAVACALVLLTAPWSWVAIPIAVAAVCWGVRRATGPARQAQWMLTAWAVCAYIFADVLESRGHGLWHWLGPLPPLALLLGGWLALDEAFLNPTVRKRAATWIFSIGLVAAAVAIFLAIHGPLGFTIFDHSVVLAAPASSVALLIAAAAVIAGVAGNLLFRRRNQLRIANCFLAGGLAGLIVAIQIGLVLVSPYFSSQILADAIRPELKPNDVVVIDGSYRNASSMAFYLERPVRLIPTTPVDETNDTVALPEIWNSGARVFLWTSAAHPPAVPGESFVVARSGGKEILSNQPNSAGASF